MDNRPYLGCADCGEPLFPATTRGRFDRDGNYIQHADSCCCRWCEWLWLEDAVPVRCDCGAHCTVEVDEDRAYAHLVAVEVPDEVEP